MSRILIDLSQFCREPGRTGIQRVLCQMLSHWPRNHVPADVGVLHAGEFHALPVSAAAERLRLYFDAPDTGDSAMSSDGMTASFTACAHRRIALKKLFNNYAAYFLPESSFRDDILDSLDHCLSHALDRTFVTLFDALPQTNPEVFGGAHQRPTSRFYRLVARAENVACISRATRECLEMRLRRKPVSNGKVLQLGADSLDRPSAHSVPATPTFVALGTVEPRKNHHLILAAFDRLWARGHDYRLVVIGAAGWHEPQFLTALNGRANDGTGRLEWIKSGSDAKIARALSEATAALYVSELEGYGLPAVEALHAGCPLIVSSKIPALAGLPPAGQIRLEKVSPELIAEAVSTVADPVRAHKLASEANGLELPGWRDFTLNMASWIGDSLARRMN